MDNSDPPKPKSKKKWLWIGGGLLLLFIIIGAMGDKNDGEKVGSSAENAAIEKTAAKNKDKNEPSQYKIGNQIKLGKSVVTVNKVEYSQGGTYQKPQTDNEWVNLNITVENTDSSQQYLTTLGQMFVRDGQGNSYQVAVTDKSVESVNNNLDGAILAKSKRTGWVGFEIPKGATGLQFQYNGSLWGGGTVIVDLGR